MHPMLHLHPAGMLLQFHTELACTQDGEVDLSMLCELDRLDGDIEALLCFQSTR